jgi:hypothetical protein
MDPTKDYILRAPEPITVKGGVNLTGGRNVVWIGGEIRHDTSYGTDKNIVDDAQRGIYIKDWIGTMHIEGIWIHGIYLAEGINIAAHDDTSRLNLQNIRVGTVQPIGGTHADCIQNWAGPRYYNIDMLSCQTGLQGLMLQPRRFSTFHTALFDMRRANFTGPGTYKIYKGVDSGTVWDRANLIDVYTDNRANSPATCGCFPHTNAEWAPISVGRPPGGDFVPLNSVGTNYVSPGYN